MDEIITLEVPEIRDWLPVTPPNPLATEEEAFARLLPELLTTHKGQYVAIFGGRVVGSGAEEVATLKRAYAEYGYRPILVQQVTDKPRVVHCNGVLMTSTLSRGSNR